MAHPVNGPRAEIPFDDDGYPAALRVVRNAPERLYVIGAVSALEEGLAVVGARKATPYGLSCAYRFSEIAASRGIRIISGGARGCDSRSHMAALAQGVPTVVFMGCGGNHVYPRENKGLFQQIVDGGGAIVSEHGWDVEPRGWMFRERNRLIAGLAKATLIVEAGLPSGTFSTADEALAADREVLVIPGAITSPSSHGANRLIYQGATPMVDEEVFNDHLTSLFGEPIYPRASGADGEDETAGAFGDVLAALKASPLSLEEMRAMLVPTFGSGALSELMVWLAKEKQASRIERFADGRYGAIMRSAR